MAEGATPRGVVTPLSSIFAVEETQRAAERIEDMIEEKRGELDIVSQFIADNSSLVNLVTKLPEELHHDVMVPFGRAAFFPGKLVHTNEFMVLLGEGYYVERTAKQTVEILNRRGKVLESQMESLRANIRDLRAEASFFAATASGAAEGLVEITEDYFEDSGRFDQFHSNDPADGCEDDEYARLMSRFDELEKEEAAAELRCGHDEDEEATTHGGRNNIAKHEDDRTSLASGAVLDESLIQHVISEAPNSTTTAVLQRDGNPSQQTLVRTATTFSETKKNSEEQMKFTKSAQAFTGSIVERTGDFQKVAPSQDADPPQSKPLSRFKMQRR